MSNIPVSTYDAQHTLWIAIEGDVSFSRKERFLDSLDVKWVEWKPDWQCAQLEIDHEWALNFFNYDTFSTMWLVSELRDLRLENNLLGIVVVVDCAEAKSFRAAQTLIKSCVAHLDSIPVIVALANEDKEAAWDSDSVRTLLKIPRSIQMIPCILNDAVSRKALLTELLQPTLHKSPEQAIQASVG